MSHRLAGRIPYNHAAVLKGTFLNLPSGILSEDEVVPPEGLCVYRPKTFGTET